MEEKRCEGQNTLDFKCENIFSNVGKPSSSEDNTTESLNIHAKLSRENDLASPTPEKTTRPPRTKNGGSASIVRSSKGICKDFQNEDGVILPDKYRLIVDFFDSMVTSMRLLNLRRKLCSFQNISIQVEILTKRRFFSNHLAQIKYIFPEAIQIEKILIHDESSLCMKPEMKISISGSEFEGHPDQSVAVTLHKNFHEHLLGILSAQSEGSDIPEALLPEPFNQKKDLMSLRSLPPRSLPGLPQQISVKPESLMNSLHFGPSFRKHFSQKMAVEGVKTPLLASPVPLISITAANESHHSAKSSMKEDDSPTIDNESPAKLKISPDCSGNASFIEGTPLKPSAFSTPLKLETPVQAAPKRSMGSPEDIDGGSCVGDNAIEAQSSNHSASRRALMFSSALEAEKKDASSNTLATEDGRCIFDASDEAETSKATGVYAEEEASPSSVVPKSGQTGRSKRNMMPACLPDLFKTIHRVFQSASRSSITKEELVQKIIWQSLDVVETKEVEEQLKLLEELLPDWICRKIVSSGDILYCLKISADPKPALERLVKAT